MQRAELVVPCRNIVIEIDGMLCINVQLITLNV